MSNIFYSDQKHSTETTHPVQACLTLFCDLNLSPAKLGLLDILDTEITAALGVDLCFVPW